MTASATHYYVYYRVSPERAAAARAVVACIFTTLEEQSGIAGRLLHRADEPLLWMEVYDGVLDASAFESALKALVDKHAFSTLLPAGTSRIVERFVAGAP